MYHLFDERAEAIEFKVMEESNVTGKKLKDLKLKPHTLVSFINKSGRIIIPTGNDSIEVGDTVMIVTKNKGFTALTDILR